MQNIKEIESEIIEEFNLLGEDWEARYEYIIELGKELPQMSESLKTDERLIKGCQSRVWLHSELKDGKVYYTVDSDAAIPKGIVALVSRVLSGHTPDEIMAAELNFINQIGLKEHLSPTRANGLVSMIKQMKMDAIALKEVENKM